MNIYLVGESVKNFYNYDHMIKCLENKHYLLRKMVGNLSKKIRIWKNEKKS